MSSYFELVYAFLFLPITILVYAVTPKRFKYIVLLLASFIFFFMISNKLIFFLIASILSIYFGANRLKKIDINLDKVLENTDKDDRKVVKKKYKNKKKLVLVLVILFNVAVLFSFKYLKFFLTNTNIILDWLNIDYSFKVVKFLAPIGISYYTLQAIGYMVDVYNGKVEAEKNPLKLALFLSFFPQIMEGPIARYEETASELVKPHKIEYKNLCFGYQRIMFGFFKKLVIADRLNIMVKMIFEDYMSYSGIATWFGVIGYTIMLYAEFSGTMDVVIGTGETFGIKLPENFRQPFFAKNISEFWTRWHISLGAWFRNYIFYPVSLSKPMKKITTSARKVLGNHYGPLISGSVALLAVWLLNGLWHGAGWNYIFFGLYHFVLILMGSLMENVVIKITTKLHIDRTSKIYRVLQSIKMTIFVFIGELFFRAPTVSMGFDMLKKMFTSFSVPKGELLSIGLDIADYLILVIALVFIFVISLLREKNISIREEISKKPIIVRWTLYYALILSIIIFGAYGAGYAPVDPIYADF